MSSPTRILVLGLGGLGCPAALALATEAKARALPLALRLCDDDVVDRSNLARQTLYRPDDVGRRKVDAAADALGRRAPDAPLELEKVHEKFNQSTENNLLDGIHWVLDGTDSPETRFLANDRALARGVPLIHGAALGWAGQLLSIRPGGPCLRCLFEGPPPPGTIPACSEAGVAGPLCALVGATMAAEALRGISGQPLRAQGKLLRWDGLRGTARAIPVPRDPGCSACAR